MRVKKTTAPVEREIAISTEFNKLEGFLKFSGAVETGGEAKNRIQNEPGFLFCKKENLSPIVVEIKY